MNTTTLIFDNFFTIKPDGVVLSDYGIIATKQLLDKYSGGQIKDIADVSRSALLNYVNRFNKISKRGQEALQKLVIDFNSHSGDKDYEHQIQKSFREFTDKELLQELKKRGYNVFVSV